MAKAAVMAIVLNLFLTLLAMALESPKGVNIFSSYPPVSDPAVSSQAAGCRPVGVGDVADGKENFSLKIALDAPDRPVNLYLALYAPALDPKAIFFMNEAGNFIPVSTDSPSVPLWLREVSSDVNITVIENIPASMLPSGDYIIYLLMTPSDEKRPFDGSNYIWVTTMMLVDGVIVKPAEPITPY